MHDNTPLRHRALRELHGKVSVVMAFDPQAIFANLAEKEKIKGHHSAEGRTIRVLSRALNGWSTGNLRAVDVLVLCDQAMEDWLKARLKVPAWSARSLPELLEGAVKEEILLRSDAVCVQRMHTFRSRLRDESAGAVAREAEAALEFCISLVEKYW